MEKNMSEPTAVDHEGVADGTVLIYFTKKERYKGTMQ